MQVLAISTPHNTQTTRGLTNEPHKRLSHGFQCRSFPMGVIFSALHIALIPASKCCLTAVLGLQ